MFSFAVNASNGALSLIGSPVAAGDGHSMNVDPSGKYLLVGNAGSDNVSVFAIDPNTGMLTQQFTPTGREPSSVVTIGEDC